MFSSFEYKSISLKSIHLDIDNPRIVTERKLKTQEEIVNYLFLYEDLGPFIQKIALEGKNFGAERPYVVREGRIYTVIEGNTRIAAYKVLCDLIDVPSKFAAAVPKISDGLKAALLNVDCSIAPSRDALMPIMANAHFGLGDKSKWGYLGSRKAVYNAWRGGKDVSSLASTFDRTDGQIRELIIEYLLYEKALSFKWSKEEKAVLTKPSVAFNPPVRFLQTKGHKEKIGITFDTDSLSVKFKDAEAEKKFRHLIFKLVISPKSSGLKATSTYDSVFKDYGEASTAAAKSDEKAKASGGGGSDRASATDTGDGGSADGDSGGKAGGASAKPGTLFSYPVSLNSGLLQRLMDEARELKVKKYPACATFLLRNIVESLLKHIIDQQKANPASKQLDLEAAINLAVSAAVTLPKEDVKVLKTFQKQYVLYLNLGAHGNVIPNEQMVLAARDCIDQFIKKNI